MTLLAPSPDLLSRERLPMTLPTSLPPGFDQFLDADRFAELQAMEADLQARAAALVPLVAAVVEADLAICGQLLEIADRACVLFDDHDPQARAFEVLLAAVGSERTTRILWCMSEAIGHTGPATFDALTALEKELAQP